LFIIFFTVDHSPITTKIVINKVTLITLHGITQKLTVASIDMSRALAVVVGNGPVTAAVIVMVALFAIAPNAKINTDKTSVRNIKLG